MQRRAGFVAPYEMAARGVEEALRQADGMGGHLAPTEGGVTEYVAGGADGVTSGRREAGGRAWRRCEAGGRSMERVEACVREGRVTV